MRRREFITGTAALVAYSQLGEAEALTQGQRLSLLGGAGINPLFHRAYNLLDIPASATYYTFPARIRPKEPKRTQLIIRNLGSTVLQFGYNTGNNAQFTATFTFTLNPGQEYRENGFSTNLICVRPNVSGQGGRYSVYVEFNGITQSGSAITQAITPTPIGVPVLNVSAYGTATAQPIGLSKDRATVYGSANGTTLYQSVNNGTSWASIATFADNVQGLIETDDGEALCYTQGGAAVPGKIYKSSGWSTSHTGATWALKLTSASNAYFRNLWGGGSCFNFSGQYGVAAEYGALLNSGLDATYPTHVYFTSDYGANWAQILDIQVTPPSSYPMHMKNAVYDPYWDRIWVTYDLLTDQTHASWLYSDDHGATWNYFTLPIEWQNISASWQSNQIAPLTNRIIFGSDHTDGYYVVPRSGYRQTGTPYVSAITTGHTGSQQTNMGAFRSGVGQQFFASLINTIGDLLVPGLIMADAIDDGQTLTEMWRDDSLKNTGKGVWDVIGPTSGGKFLAKVSGSTPKTLIGTIVQGVQGQYDQYANLTGDGATTVFTFPHFLSVTPTTLLAYPQNAVSAAIVAPTVTADSTNITLTFSVAPTNAAVYSFALRYA